MATVSEVCQKIEDDVESMLQKYDKDGDRSLTRSEVIEYFTQNKVKNPKISAVMIFKLLDTDRDDTISINEIRKHATKLNQKNLEDAITREVKQFLGRHDTNGDQKITFDEFVEDLVKTEKMDKETAKDTADFFFSEIDTDKDNILTVAELRKYVGSLANPQQ
ncbi:hypothetical protein DICPUDRAFT_47964 [Dictyostelium purpureum]|uniref:EF-hand domain-containing protein n=1 Tax=Dictyostelium purpureum TaxID=5786 RepID=F0ZM82_DICPU|nr:uncharacterized protein DICPUDRAFT_47964 [Dictyostelium purpureum]EGC34950.1 hypothetical protein DICPUDRAFT_47964 [Dictyostelium purpureum]|eukprot:XP_003288531.1 hypothetical protein DICPUDRAFT_47964 [Dictyostelium purpureum]